jgi:hypothetical protein
MGCKHLTEDLLILMVLSQILEHPNVTELSYLVPHSQCSLKENPKILQNLRSKNNKFGENF